jgi:citrate lyase subunit beta/citryl-CoA lyase
MRSLLFVPADGGSKLDKAIASGADAVIVDLEDSIAPARKPAARASAAAFLKSAGMDQKRPRLFVRVNGISTGLIDADLDAIVPARPDAILLPKAEGGASVIHADAKLTAREAISGVDDGHIKIAAQAIETAAGIFQIGTFRGASGRLIGLTWGPEDLSAELGAEANRDAAGQLTEPYRLARSLCLFCAAAADVSAIETVYVDYRNIEGLRRDTETARRDGFSARLAIHPAQVPVINEVFTPTPEAIGRARAVIDAFAAAPDAGAIGIDGVMYDRPHLVRANALLARAKAAGLA